MNIHLPRRICGNVDVAVQREWLVTNGIGGFASGTVAGALTRRYHGLLLAALNPPVGRMLLVAKLDETATARGQQYPLYTNFWPSGLERPNACQCLRCFDLISGVATWTFDLGGGLLTKRVWMEAGHNVTYVQYELATTPLSPREGQGNGQDRGAYPAPPSLTLDCRLLVNDRHYHHLARANGRAFQIEPRGPELVFRSSAAAVPISARCVDESALEAAWRAEHDWCLGFHLPIEAERGFDHLEDHLCAGACRLRLEPGQVATLCLAAGDDRAVDPRGALRRHQERARTRVDDWARHAGVRPAKAPAPLAQLVLAADQFIVARPARDEPDGHTIMAGYPWFTDWGRDTMIALPGLTLVTGRPDVARQILLTWARHAREGLIPNRFPDEGGQPEYHTADATLWYLWAIDQYIRATGDVPTLVELFPVMKDIVAWHRRGTRHNIRVGDDGLVQAGEEGVNLTWMDAKIGQRVITPRMGKPVELSALWYDALCNMARLADLVNEPGDEYARLARTTRASFGRFWNSARDCCFDVLDGPGGDDATIRPNQVFAVSLTHSPLERERQLAVVRTVERLLLTWFGLRSLAPNEPGYRGRYAGGPVERDESYHQGTSWGWLLGPLVIAHHRVYRDHARARQLLQPMFGQLWTGGVGSLSEIHDADEPHRPNGCPAQAWSVAETLRAWQVTQVHADDQPR